MDLKNIDSARDAAYRLETNKRLSELEAGLRALDAGVLGLKDRVEKASGLRGRIDRHSEDIDSLCDRLDALETHTPFDPPLSGCRETAWVVKTVHDHGPCGLARSPGAFVWEASFTGNGVDQILRFTARSDAETLARLLGIGEPALVYTDTMEEVGR